MLRAHLTEEAGASVDSGPSPQLHPCIALSFVTAALHPTRMRPPVHRKYLRVSLPPRLVIHTSTTL